MWRGAGVFNPFFIHDRESTDGAAFFWGDAHNLSYRYSQSREHWLRGLFWGVKIVDIVRVL